MDSEWLKCFDIFREKGKANCFMDANYAVWESLMWLYIGLLVDYIL
jgi:hypothetical protein